MSAAASDDCGAVLVVGFPASGKSTAAAYLAEVLGAPVLDKDRFAPLLEESVLQKLTGNRYDRDSETYRTLVGPGIYDGLIPTGRTESSPTLRCTEHAPKPS